MNQIYQQTASKLGVEEDVVRAVGEHAFAWLRLRMSELDMDESQVLITGLGTVKLLTNKMKKLVASGRLSKEDEEKTIKLLAKFDKT